MYEYMTRHMVALREIPYAGQNIVAGQAFVATPNDAEYFKLHGRARDANPGEAAEFTPPVAAHVPQPVIELPPAGSGEPVHDEEDDDEVIKSALPAHDALRDEQLQDPQDGESVVYEAQDAVGAVQESSPADLILTSTTNPQPARRGRPPRSTTTKP